VDEGGSRSPSLSCRIRIVGDLSPGVILPPAICYGQAKSATSEKRMSWGLALWESAFLHASSVADRPPRPQLNSRYCGRVDRGVAEFLGVLDRRTHSRAEGLRVHPAELSSN